ncbi:DUF2059 domain-containing protein [Ferrovibrio sp.]|uniref:DUF2059 domain-containing protein n=1 Tax=Ferrovibrio sp. TaxID=1917215 RepID=UPI003D096100
MRKLLAIALLLAFGFAAEARAQAAPATVNQETLAEARKLLVVTRMQTHMDMMMSHMMTMLTDLLSKANPGKQEEVRKAVTELFLPEMRAALPGLLDEIAKLYTLHFSADELRQVVAFYESPVGRKAIDTMPAITQQSMAMGQAWGQQVAQRAIEKHAETLRQRGITNL